MNSQNNTHAGLAQVHVGDTVMVYTNSVCTFREKVTKITQGPHISETTARLHCGEFYISATDLYTEYVLVCPEVVPGELQQLVGTLQRGGQSRIIVARVFNNRYEDCYTLADRVTGARLCSRVATVEYAPLVFECGTWREGKPSPEDSETKYFVGDLELEMPEAFDPSLYN